MFRKEKRSVINRQDLSSEKLGVYTCVIRVYLLHQLLTVGCLFYMIACQACRLVLSLSFDSSQLLQLRCCRLSQRHLRVVTAQLAEEWESNMLFRVRAGTQVGMHHHQHVLLYMYERSIERHRMWLVKINLHVHAMSIRATDRMYIPAISDPMPDIHACTLLSSQTFMPTPK